MSKTIDIAYIIRPIKHIIDPRQLDIIPRNSHVKLKYLVIHGSIAAKCLRATSGLFFPNLLDQSACKMRLALACVVIILHDDWSTKLEENRLGGALKHLAAMLYTDHLASFLFFMPNV